MKRAIPVASVMVFCAALGSGPAQGQERTPREAHRFLASMWSDRFNQIRTDHVLNLQNETSSGLSTTADGAGCSSVFSSNQQGASASVIIDWEKVGQVETASGNAAYLNVYGGSQYPRIGFLFASEADARRVFNAMKFLHESCQESSAF